MDSNKRRFHAGGGRERAQKLDLERDLQRECGRSQDFREGTIAFVQKRKGVFKSR